MIIFLASRTKMLRARQFIAELKTALAAYKEDNPVAARIDGETNQIRVTIKPITDWPGAIVGDAIHNMRSALDLMASELARLNCKSDKDVYFPFSDTGDKLDDAIKRRNFDKAGQDAVDLLKTFAPYRGGNDALRAIHDLDVQDKHTALILTTSHLGINFEAAYDIRDPGAGVVATVADPVHYMFPKDGLFGGEQTIETLEHLVQLVDGILEAFASMVALRR